MNFVAEVAVALLLLKEVAEVVVALLLLKEVVVALLLLVVVVVAEELLLEEEEAEVVRHEHLHQSNHQKIQAVERLLREASVAGWGRKRHARQREFLMQLELR